MVENEFNMEITVPESIDGIQSTKLSSDDYPALI